MHGNLEDDLEVKVCYIADTFQIRETTYEAPTKEPIIGLYKKSK